MSVKKWKMGLFIVLGILLFPIWILPACIFLLCAKIAEKRKSRRAVQRWEARRRAEGEKQFAMPYHEPMHPVPDEVFASRIEEFVCIQVWSCNDYSGGITMQELVAAEHPEKKEQILAFLREHPITELLHGDRYEQACDTDRWKIRFIFDDPDLNRTIEGYGHTELTAPYLRALRNHSSQM